MRKPGARASGQHRSTNPRPRRRGSGDTGGNGEGPGPRPCLGVSGFGCLNRGCPGENGGRPTPQLARGPSSPEGSRDGRWRPGGLGAEQPAHQRRHWAPRGTEPGRRSPRSRPGRGTPGARAPQPRPRAAAPRPRLTCAPARPARTAAPGSGPLGPAARLQPPPPAAAAPRRTHRSQARLPPGPGRGPGRAAPPVHGLRPRRVRLRLRTADSSAGGGHSLGPRTPRPAPRPSISPARPAIGRARRTLPPAPPSPAPIGLMARPSGAVAGGASGSGRRGGRCRVGRPSWAAALGAVAAGAGGSPRCRSRGSRAQLLGEAPDSPGNRAGSPGDGDRTGKRAGGRVWSGAGSPASRSRPRSRSWSPAPGSPAPRRRAQPRPRPPSSPRRRAALRGPWSGKRPPMGAPRIWLRRRRAGARGPQSPGRTPSPQAALGWPLGRLAASAGTGGQAWPCTGGGQCRSARSERVRLSLFAP